MARAPAHLDAHIYSCASIIAEEPPHQVSPLPRRFGLIVSARAPAQGCRLTMRCRRTTRASPRWHALARRSPPACVTHTLVVRVLGHFLFFCFFFRDCASVYFVMQVSDCNYKHRTIVLQIILVMNRFSCLVPCSRLITHSHLERLRTIQPHQVPWCMKTLRTRSWPVSLHCHFFQKKLSLDTVV